MKPISKLFLFSLVLCHSHLSLGQTDATLPSTPSCNGPFRYNYNGDAHDIEIQGTLVVSASAGILHLSTYPAPKPPECWDLKLWQAHNELDNACGGISSSDKSLEIPCKTAPNDCASADALTKATHTVNVNCDSISIKVEPEISFHFSGNAFVATECCGTPGQPNYAIAAGSGEHFVIEGGASLKNRLSSNVVFTIPSSAHKVLINGVATLSCPSLNSYAGTMDSYLEILTTSGWQAYSPDDEGDWSFLLHWSSNRSFSQLNVNSVTKPFSTQSISKVLVPGTYRLHNDLWAWGDASIEANCGVPSPNPLDVSGAVKGSVKITAQQIFYY